MEYTPACDPPDKYDKAIQHLLKFKGDDFKWHVHLNWMTPFLSLAGCLFSFCTKSGKTENNCGCLTQIRKNHCNSPAEAATLKLTAEIRADERLPDDPLNIEPHHLPVFAEWQRRLDEELCRT